MSELEIIYEDICKAMFVGGILFLVFVVGSLINALAYDTITKPDAGLCSFIEELEEGNYYTYTTSTDCYFGSEKYFTDRLMAGFVLYPQTIMLVGTPLFLLAYYFGTVFDREKTQRRKKK